MKRRRIVIGVAIGIVLLVCITAFFSSQRASFAGECPSLAQLPWYGAELPTRKLGSIRYLAEGKYRRVLAKVATTRQEFDEVARDMNLSIVRYQMGFNVADLETVDKEFRPLGTKVSVAYGAISKKGRTTVTLYFEPSEDESKGVLYIHVP